LRFDIFNRSRLLASILMFSILVSGCSTSKDSAQTSEVMVTDTSPSLLKGLVGTYMSEWSSCVPGMQADTVTCVVGYTVKNPTDAPIELSYLDVYALVDGKIFKAAVDQGSDGVAALTQTWNPGEELKAGTYFAIPEGSTLEKIFFASDPSVNSAEFILDVNLVGVAS